MPNNLKRFLDYTGFETLVGEIKKADAKVEQAAKDYADSLASNYDAAGSSESVRTALNTTISGVQGEVDAVEKALEDEIARAKEAESANSTAASNAQSAADKAQGDVDALDERVGNLPTGTTATTIIDYINKKTEGIATDSALAELQGQLGGVQTDVATILADYLKNADKEALQALINAVDGKADANASAIADIVKDYLKSADKTELEGKIGQAQGSADAAQGYAEGVAEDLAEEVQARTEADNAQIGRIATLEEKILKLSGAMHFKGIKSELPTEVAGYEEGDVIVVGNKEYVFDGSAFVEFGDVGALAEGISALTGRMDGAEEDIADILAELEEIRDALATKVEQSDYDAKVAELESADEGLDERIGALEEKFGTGEGTVSDMVSDAKTEAINTAAQDATSKANKALDDAKIYTNTEVGKDRARLDGLEADAHTHANKAELDKIADGDKSKWDEAYSKRHEHGNKAELDKIADGDVAKWNSAEQNAKTYAKGLSDATNGEVEALKGRMTTAEGSLANKAEASALSALAEKVATAEGNIASNTAEINRFVAIPVEDIQAMFNV